MNLDYLITFRELVRLGSFSAVAKSQAISQPAVSFQIQKLESDLGTTLIDRSQKKLKLTDAGKRVLDFTHSINNEYIGLQNDLDKLRTDVAGEINIASSTIPGQFLVPVLLGEFMAFHPDTTAHVDIMDSITVIDSVKYGDYKLGFCGTVPPEREGLSSFKIASDEIILIASASHPLATGPRVEIARLTSEPFICREVTSGTRHAVEQAMSDAGFEFKGLNIKLVLSNTEAVVSAVEAGNGLAFVSSIGAKKALSLGGIRKIDVKGLAIKRDFYCIHYPARESMRLIDEFLNFTKKKVASTGWFNNS